MGCLNVDIRAFSPTLKVTIKSVGESLPLSIVASESSFNFSLSLICDASLVPYEDFFVLDGVFVDSLNHVFRTKRL